MALRAVETERHERYELRDGGTLMYTMVRDPTGDWVLHEASGREVMRDQYRNDILSRLGLNRY